MNKLLRFVRAAPLFALLWLTQMVSVYAAGTVTSTTTRMGNSDTYVMTVTATGDSSNGSFPAYTIPITGTNGADITGFSIVAVETDPGATAPTDNWDLTITTSNGLDIMNSECLNRDTSTTERCSADPIPIPSDASLNITNNSVASATITIRVYFVRQTVAKRGGSGGSVAWGSITGTIASQTDVQPILTPGYCIDITGATLGVLSTCFPAIYTSTSAPTNGVDTCTAGNGMWIRTGTPELYFCSATDTWTVTGAGSGAPTTATYVTLQSEAGLSAESSLGALADNDIVAVDVAASVATIRAATSSDMIAKFGGGSCSGYLKSDGTCDTPAGGSNPTIYATGKQTSTTISNSYTDLTGASTSTTLAAGKCLCITYRTVNATTTAKNLALVVGSTTHNIYSASSTSSGFYGQLMFCNDASVQNAQTMFPVIHATAGTAAVTLRTKDDWAEDMSTAKTIKLQGKCDTSCSDSVQVYTFTVEKLEN